jgi:hypothetical protein
MIIKRYFRIRKGTIKERKEVVFFLIKIRMSKKGGEVISRAALI